MGIPLTTEGTSGLDDFGSRNEPAEGTYHVRVEDVDDSLRQYEAVILDLEVLAGTVPGQEGKKCQLWFSVKPSKQDFNKRRLTRLALILGLITPGEKKDVQFRQANGRQFVVKLKKETYDGETRLKCPFMDFWPVGDPAVKDVPLDQTATPLAEPAAPGDAPADPWKNIA